MLLQSDIMPLKQPHLAKMKLSIQIILVIGVVIIAIALVVIIWFFSFVWENNYGERTILIDSISAQLTIFEILVAFAGIGAAILGFFGYQNLKKAITSEVIESINDIVSTRVNSILNEKDYDSTSHKTDTSTIETSSKDKSQENV